MPEAYEAMRQGNLEMTWMQIGKAAPVDPYMLAVVGPGILTTVGAVDNLDKTSTYQMLVDRMAKNQQVKVFGVGHMSFGMGVGGKKRYAAPADFVGKKVRSMGPAENPVLEAWKANPVVMAFGEVPSALDPPSGCRFHPRCPHAMPRCSKEVPLRHDVAPGHSVACHLY